MIAPRDLVMHELIGLEVKVVSCTNKRLEGLSGRVIDETRNILRIETLKGEKSLAKDNCTFSFHLPSGEWVRVEGSLLVSRPEDRIKKKFRKW
ncbi:MAG: ribonuclease P protein component 1 [Candidatus Aenigmarchaeota archaeon]|nr:ribonuclease P protein component 1 [Candidatus Aenigmarchaeota archaeon]